MSCEPPAVLTRQLWAVLPASIDDPAAPSGGNLYDRRVLDLLATGTTRLHLGRAGEAEADDGVDPGRVERAGGLAAREVHEIALEGSWPRPGDVAREALARALADIPDQSDVLLDGLVACGVPELLEPHAKRLRLIVLVHLPLSDETGLSRDEATELRELERRTVRIATTVIATSEAAARHIAEMHDLSGVRVASPGVAAAAFTRPEPSGRRLLCVASVTPRKGQDLLVDVLENDLADLDWECTLIGALIRPVPHRDPRIHFAGPRTGAALDAAYGNADLFVLPSRAETYGMVVTEALARGLPVLATAVGGVPEALGTAGTSTGPTGTVVTAPDLAAPGSATAGSEPTGTLPGLLVAPDDRAALATALRAWLTDADLRERWRTAAAARRATLDTWADTAHRLAAILDEPGPHAPGPDRTGPNDIRRDPDESGANPADPNDAGLEEPGRSTTGSNEAVADEAGTRHEGVQG